MPSTSHSHQGKLCSYACLCFSACNVSPNTNFMIFYLSLVLSNWIIMNVCVTTSMILVLWFIYVLESVGLLFISIFEIFLHSPSKLFSVQPIFFLQRLNASHRPLILISFGGQEGFPLCMSLWIVSITMFFGSLIVFSVVSNILSSHPVYFSF